jgi:hypothetical protein
VALTITASDWAKAGNAKAASIAKAEKRKGPPWASSPTP